ncbi:hypothetical protein CAPTEDRAFT_190784 [Capitella teleta]|uniref:Reverse transcriptase domain-containing protein n=1 Tax=Capitella teleta TaxID=283909 RepID=R7UZT6_CAPTE|nr:hypothetical protein CAPTEDRAFT_190784 [Capitella teleta]|eukprot:ELU11804.1 hypothetical protein CAPTEDRAFT_190784 [Capitella teleta]
MLKKLNETNRKRMQDLGRGAERNKNMFRELKNWMDKGKGKEELVEFLTEEGEVIKNEDDILAEIEKVWDDVILLAPSRKALACMLLTCANFASDFNVIFNASKSKLILYNVSDTVLVPFTNNYLDIVPTEKHLGFPWAPVAISTSENLCKKIMSKTNMLYCNFKHLPIDALYKLFRTYCTPICMAVN